MAEYVVRKLSLTAVFAIGIASIMATSPPQPPYRFLEVSAEPAYRCPGTDVILRWSLSDAAPVAIRLLGQEYRKEAGWEALQLDATLFDDAASPAMAEFRVDLPLDDGINHVADDLIALTRPQKGPPRSRRVTTLDEDSPIDLMASHVTGDRLKLLLRPAEWDERIRITGFEIRSVRNMVCEGDEHPTPWTVAMPDGRRLVRQAGTADSGGIEPAVPPSGTWRIQPRDAACRPSPSGRSPHIAIRLTAACEGTGDAS